MLVCQFYHICIYVYLHLYLYSSSSIHKASQTIMVPCKVSNVTAKARLHR
jgi:hypothetical protein